MPSFLFRIQRSSIDIQDKSELQKLRADLLRQRKESAGAKSVTTVESEGDGTKDVTTTTEKTTEETDGGLAEVTTEVKKTTEVHKAGGATMTVTKTSTTTQVRQTGGGKGWWTFFFAILNTARYTIQSLK